MIVTKIVVDYVMIETTSLNFYTNPHYIFSFFDRLLLPSQIDSTDTYGTIDSILNLRFEISEKNLNHLFSFEYQYAVSRNFEIADNIYKKQPN